MLYVQTTESFSPRRHQITHSTSTRNERRRAEEVIIICFPDNCTSERLAIYTHRRRRKIRECIYIFVCAFAAVGNRTIYPNFSGGLHTVHYYITRTRTHTHTYIINVQRVLDASEVKRHTDVFCFVITIIHIYYIILHVPTHNFIAFVRRRFDDYTIENFRWQIVCRGKRQTKTMYVPTMLAEKFKKKNR